MNIYKQKYKQFAEFVFNIEYGYLDKKQEKHLGEFTNPTDNYYLQTPEETIKNGCGICFDTVELLRDYFMEKGIQHESYYMEYKKDDVFESYAFMIYRKNNLWYECPDNSWEELVNPKGFFDREILIKEIYEWFQSWIFKQYTNVDKTAFFLNKYKKPNMVFERKISLQKFCTLNNYQKISRYEESGMSIVFCKNKTLILVTKNNEYVFPKGHIEEGETSVIAAIRECKEESGVDLTNAKYLGECTSYDYTFSAGHLKITNNNFHHTFGVNQINKRIYVHAFELKEFQEFELENIFIKGKWVENKYVPSVITHENTKAIYEEALKLLKSSKKAV